MLKPERVSLPEFRIFQTDEYLKKMRKLPANEADFLKKKLREYVFPQLRIEPSSGKTMCFFLSAFFTFFNRTPSTDSS